MGIPALGYTRVPGVPGTQLYLAPWFTGAQAYPKNGLCFCCLYRSHGLQPAPAGFGQPVANYYGPLSTDRPIDGQTSHNPINYRVLRGFPVDWFASQGGTIARVHAWRPQTGVWTFSEDGCHRPGALCTRRGQLWRTLREDPEGPILRARDVRCCLVGSDSGGHPSNFKEFLASGDPDVR